MRIAEDPLTPVIETERLRLRRHEIGDFKHCVAMWADPVIARHTIGDPSTPQRTWSRMLAYRGHWELMGFGYWAVEEKISCRYVGELGFADFKRDQQQEIAGLPEIGWVLSSQAHGKGYATEALRAAVAWADHHLEGASTACIIHRDNLRSLRVAQKIGYVTALKAATDEKPEILFIRHRPTVSEPRGH